MTVMARSIFRLATSVVIAGSIYACGDDDSPTDAGSRDGGPASDAGVDCGTADPMPGPGFFACGDRWCEKNVEFCCNASTSLLTCQALECRAWGSPMDDCEGYAFDCGPPTLLCPEGEVCCEQGASLRCGSDCAAAIWCDDASRDCPASMPFCCAELEGPRLCRSEAC
jgi:hypothetical protein